MLDPDYRITSDENALGGYIKPYEAYVAGFGILIGS
jgi:hypothetical protein